MPLATVVVAAMLALSGPALAAGGGGHSSGPANQPFYERINGLTVNLLSRAQLRGQLVVNLRLETNPAGAKEIKHFEPKLRDAYNHRLLRLGQTILDIRRPLDLKRMERTLQAATDNVLGHEVATVLLTSAIVRRQ